MAGSCGGDEKKGKGGPHCPFRGVRRASCGQWVAEISDPDRGAPLWLGTFFSSLEAALAYDHGARKLYGPAADVNVPDLVVCSPDNSDDEECYDVGDILLAATDDDDEDSPSDINSDSDSNDVPSPAELGVAVVPAAKVTAPIPIPTKAVNNVAARYSRSTGSEESVNSYVPTLAGVRVGVRVEAEADDQLDKCDDFDGQSWDDDIDVDQWLNMDFSNGKFPPNKPDGDKCEGPGSKKTM